MNRTPASSVSDRRLGRRRVFVVHPHHQQGAEHEQRRAHAVHHARAGRVQQAAQRRPADDGRLHRAAVEGQRPRQQRRRHQQRRQRLLRGHLEALGHAEHEAQGQDEVARGPAFMAGQHQHQGAHGLHHQRQRHHAAAVVAVGHVAGHQRERERGQELVQAHQAQVPGAAGQVVHLPAHGHHQHLAGAGARQARAPEAHEGRVGEEAELGDAGGSRVVGGSGHAGADVRGPGFARRCIRLPLARFCADAIPAFAGCEAAAPRCGYVGCWQGGSEGDPP
jgi:hypothetical protein